MPIGNAEIVVKEITQYSTRLRRNDENPTFIARNTDVPDEVRHYSRTDEHYRRTLCSFPVRNLKLLHEPSVVEIDEYITDFPTTIEEDLRCFPKVVCPPFDLDKLYRRPEGQDPGFTEKDVRHEYLGMLLECLESNGLVGKSDFVAKRGCFVQIAASPLHARDKESDKGFAIGVQKLNNVYYFYKYQLNKNDLCPIVPREKRFFTPLKDYKGMKFETYVTREENEELPNSDIEMDFNREFCSVVSFNLRGSSVIIAGEVDCCHSYDKTKYVELKTTHKKPHRNTLLKWWLQSYLLGVEELVCGVKENDNRMVKEVETYFVDD